MTAYKVTIEDLSGVGGPMGTDAVKIIATEYRSEKLSSMQFILDDYYKRTGKRTLPKPTVNKKGEIYWDCLSVGYSIKEIEIK